MFRQGDPVKAQLDGPPDQVWGVDEGAVGKDSGMEVKVKSLHKKPWLSAGAKDILEGGHLGRIVNNSPGEVKEEWGSLGFKKKMF
jgi:hypothetical protein